MTENEALKLMESLVIDPKCELVKTLDFKATVIKALEEIQQHREKVQAFEAIGTIEEFKALKDNQRKCEDCAGCTNWKCDCANIRDKAISDFLLKICEKYTEEEQKGNYSHLCCNIKQDIADIADIAEQMKGGAEVFQMPSDEEVEV